MLSQKSKGILTLAGTVLTHLIIGNILGFSNIIPYLKSYLYYQNSNITEEDLFFISPIAISIANILPIITGFLDNFYGTKFLLIVGMMLLVISQLLVHTYITNYKILVLAYILFGICNSLTYLPNLKNCWKYFPEKKGLITGLVLSSFGLSAFIFTAIGDYIINPESKPKNNQKVYSEEIANKCLDYIQFYLYSICILGILASIMVFTFKDENKEEKKNEIETNDLGLNMPILNFDKIETVENKNNEKSVKIVEHDINQKSDTNYPSLIQCIFSKEFLLCLIIVPCTTLFGNALPNLYRTFGSIKFKEEYYLQILSKCFTLLNTIARIIWGWILDKYGFTIPYFIVCINQIICSGFFYHASSSLITYYLVCCFGVLSYAGHFILFPNLINKKFGVDNSVILLGICGFLIAFTSILGPILIKIIVKNKEDYFIYFIINCCATIISAILIWFIKYEKYEKLKKYK
jgi:OFA family oxalate/formate antiporter-like MFS transporter